MKLIRLKPVPALYEITDIDNSESVLSACEDIEKVLTSGLEYLIKFPNPALKALGEYVQTLIKNKHAELAVGEVPTLTSAILGIPDKGIFNLIVAPPDWGKRCSTNPVHEFGGIVYCSSQVIDAYNDKIDENILLQTLRHASQYLLSIGDVMFNQYQKNILTKHPKGIGHIDLYQRKPIELLN